MTNDMNEEMGLKIGLGISGLQEECTSRINLHFAILQEIGQFFLKT
jgi:hypothetical protein